MRFHSEFHQRLHCRDNSGREIATSEFVLSGIGQPNDAIDGVEFRARVISAQLAKQRLKWAVKLFLNVHAALLVRQFRYPVDRRPRADKSGVAKMVFGLSFPQCRCQYRRNGSLRLCTQIGCSEVVVFPHTSQLPHSVRQMRVRVGRRRSDRHWRAKEKYFKLWSAR